VRAEPPEAARLKREIAEKVAEYYRVVHAPKPFVPLRDRVHYAGRVFAEEELLNLVDCALDFWLTLGPWGDRFEHKLKQWLGVADFAAVSSGSAANLTCIMALMSAQLPEPLRPGDEVITPAVTFPTTLSPIVHSGLVPVFVDCEVDTCNLNPQLLASAIGPRTRAIMAPHTLANPCDMDVLGELVQRHRLYLVEDACDALGSTFRGRLVGTFGHLASFSFFPAHHMTMGEGGGVATSDPRLGRIVRSVRDWGRDCWCAPGESNTCGNRFGWQLGDLPPGYDHKYIFSNLGYNFKPTDLQAAIGVAQAARLPEFCRQRRENFRVLYQGLQKYEEYLILPRLDPRSDPAWFGLPITVQNGADRDRLVQFLEAANIETRRIFAGNILRQPAFRNLACRIHGTLEQTDRIMRDSFFVGVYPGLTSPMLEFVLRRFDEFFASRQNWT
jgi:CDP-6-deoxy-D-xylo-4-hexulose-3-dehydrase